MSPRLGKFSSPRSKNITLRARARRDMIDAERRLSKIDGRFACDVSDGMGFSNIVTIHAKKLI